MGAFFDASLPLLRMSILIRLLNKWVMHIKIKWVMKLKLTFMSTILVTELKQTLLLIHNH